MTALNWLQAWVQYITMFARVQLQAWVRYNVCEKSGVAHLLFILLCQFLAYCSRVSPKTIVTTGPEEQSINLLDLLAYYSSLWLLNLLFQFVLFASVLSKQEPPQLTCYYSILSTDLALVDLAVVLVVLTVLLLLICQFHKCGSSWSTLWLLLFESFSQYQLAWSTQQRGITYCWHWQQKQSTTTYSRPAQQGSSNWSNLVGFSLRWQKGYYRRQATRLLLMWRATGGQFEPKQAPNQRMFERSGGVVGSIPERSQALDWSCGGQRGAAREMWSAGATEELWPAGMELRLSIGAEEDRGRWGCCGLENPDRGEDPGRGARRRGGTWRRDGPGGREGRGGREEDDDPSRIFKSGVVWYLYTFSPGPKILRATTISERREYKT